MCMCLHEHVSMSMPARTCIVNKVLKISMCVCVSYQILRYPIHDIYWSSIVDISYRMIQYAQTPVSLDL